MTLSNDHQAKKNSSEADQIPLLEEKLHITRQKHKVGEVVVRKEVETRMVQVPIRREKLVIQRVGKHPKQLAEVVIGEEKVNGFDYDELAEGETLCINKSHYLSLSTAQELLTSISQKFPAAKIKVRLEIVSNSAEEQIQFQDICGRYQQFK